jgi:hypothetical protein
MKLFLLFTALVAAAAAPHKQCPAPAASQPGADSCSCAVGCAECTEGTSCTKAKDGYYIVATTGIATQCEGTCTTCTEAAKCATCAADEALDSGTNLCVDIPDWCGGATPAVASGTWTCSACADGFFPAVAGTFSAAGCTECNDSCATCTEAGKCATCNPTGNAMTDEIDSTTNLCVASPGAWCGAFTVAGGTKTCTKCAETSGTATVLNQAWWDALTTSQSASATAQGYKLGDTWYDPGTAYKLITTTPATTTFTVDTCKAEACDDIAKCVYTPMTLSPYTAATQLCPAPAVGGTAGTAGTAGTGPDTGTKAAGHTVQASLSVLLAGLALAMRQ